MFLSGGNMNIWDGALVTTVTGKNITSNQKASSQYNDREHAGHYLQILHSHVVVL